MVKPEIEKASKRGRPSLAPGQRKRNNVTIRMRDEVKSAVQDAGSAKGRSLSEEIEYRVERSLLVEDHFALAFEDARTADFVRETLETKRLIEAYQKKSIWDDLESHEAMKAALTRLINQRAPKPSTSLKRRQTAYERYKEKEEKAWRDKGGGLGLLATGLEADPPPKLEPGPMEMARRIGCYAADEVRKSRVKALADALRKGATEED